MEGLIQMLFFVKSKNGGVYKYITLTNRGTEAASILRQPLHTSPFRGGGIV